jgi:hypothetical protein
LLLLLESLLASLTQSAGAGKFPLAERPGNHLFSDLFGFIHDKVDLAMQKSAAALGFALTLFAGLPFRAHSRELTIFRLGDSGLASVCCQRAVYLRRVRRGSVTSKIPVCSTKG